MIAHEQFAQAIAAAGLTSPPEIVADGRLHRFASNGNASDDAGYYTLHDGEIPFGSFGCFRSGIKRRWRFDAGRRLTKTSCVHTSRRRSRIVSAGRRSASSIALRRQ